MLNTIISNPITITELIMCLLVALFLGIFIAIIFSYKNKFSSSLSITLAIIPMAMAMITILINGNLGMAVAVAGGFTLVRFRSIKGTGREVSAIFVAMSIGAICGMGYIVMAVIFFVLVAFAVIILTYIDFGGSNNKKSLRITIPENYDYEHLFDDVFKKYGVSGELVKIKTTNLGSLIDVTYQIDMKNKTVSKPMLDDIRSLNANLCVLVSEFEEEREIL